MELIDVKLSNAQISMMVINGYFIKNANGTYSTTEKFGNYLKKWVDSQNA